MAKFYITNNKNNMKIIYFFRHGETDWNVKNLEYCEENHNASLNEKGIEQAKKNTIKLKDKNIKYIYTSKLKRAVETSKILAEQLNIDYEIVDGLEEHSIYDNSVIGLTREVIKEKINKNKYYILRNSKDNLMDWRPLKCETRREARNRIVNTVNNICKKDNNDIIAISSHGTILRELLRFYNFEDDSKLANCEVIKGQYNDNKLKIIRRIKNEN